MATVPSSAFSLQPQHWQRELDGKRLQPHDKDGTAQPFHRSTASPCAQGAPVCTGHTSCHRVPVTQGCPCVLMTHGLFPCPDTGAVPMCS